MSDWVNEVNELESISHQPPTNTVDLNNEAGSFNIAVIPEPNDVVQTRQATLEIRSQADVNIGPRQSQIPPIGISSVSTVPRPNSTPPLLAAVNPLPMFQLPTVPTAPVNVPLPIFLTTVQSTIPPATPTAVTIQDLAKLLTAAKKTIFLSGN